LDPGKCQLKDIRKADPKGQGRHSFTAQQQTLTRARPGSGNRKRLRRSLAKEWRKIRNRRRDFHHKTARVLVDSCDLIALEDLNVAGMSRRPAPKPDPVQPGGYLPNGAAERAGLGSGRARAA
jgi:putative transposase